MKEILQTMYTDQAKKRNNIYKRDEAVMRLCWAILSWLKVIGVVRHSDIILTNETL